MRCSRFEMSYFAWLGGHDSPLQRRSISNDRLHATCMGRNLTGITRTIVNMIRRSPWNNHQSARAFGLWFQRRRDNLPPRLTAIDALKWHRRHGLPFSALRRLKHRVVCRLLTRLKSMLRSRRDRADVGRPEQDTYRGRRMDAADREYVLAGSLEALKAKGRLVVQGGHRPILIVYDRGRIFALDNRCPHMGFPLERGTVEDGILTCHWHHARFDLESGCTFDLWADDVPHCAVEVRDGDIWVATTFSHADP